MWDGKRSLHEQEELKGCTSSPCRDPSVLDPPRAEVYPWKWENLEKRCWSSLKPSLRTPILCFRVTVEWEGAQKKRHWERHLSCPQIKVNFRALVRTRPNNHPQLLCLLLMVLLLPSNTHRSFRAALSSEKSLLEAERCWRGILKQLNTSLLCWQLHKSIPTFQSWKCGCVCCLFYLFFFPMEKSRKVENELLWLWILP